MRVSSQRVEKQAAGAGPEGTPAWHLLVDGLLPEQLETAIASAEIQMSYGDELYERIRRVSADPDPSTDRNEERSAHNLGSR